MKHIWLWWKKDDLRTEQRQLVEEGRDIEGVKAEFERLLQPDVPEDAAFQEAVNALLDKTSLLPARANYQYVEPSDLAGIRAERPSGPRTMPLKLNEASKLSRISGAWLGRCAGCLLGKPIEGLHRPKLQALLDRTGSREITDYLWRLPGLGDEDFRNWRNTTYMPEDDDTNYTVTGMALVKKKGVGFSPADMADFWMDNLPILHTCTAERVAYRNFAHNIEPPRSAVVRNPYREWIGAQIRADFFGYVALGRPEWAAELAWRDASISHVKNGIYGEMWVAAMLAAAAGDADLRRVIDTGLGEIPAKSRLAEAIREVLAWHASKTPYEETVQRIHQRWNENDPHDWCHTISNAQIVALGLLYGDGDFEKAITRAVYPCFDTDCNGATVGSIMGMTLGVEGLPAKWTSVMNDTIHTGLTGYHVSKISQLAEEMFQLHKAEQSKAS
jgi:ADP-ribosylglycohydrolase